MSPERAVGRLLRPIRSDDRYLAWRDARIADAPATVQLSSSAFEDGGAIPVRYAGAGVGDNLSPPLAWFGAPPATVELALIIQDPDAPLPRPAVHVIATGIDPDWSVIPKGALAPRSNPSIVLGRGLFGRIGYAGPRPLRGHGAASIYVPDFCAVAPLGVAGAAKPRSRHRRDERSGSRPRRTNRRLRADVTGSRNR